MVYYRHYADFYSPGTFFDEVSRKPVDSQDTTEAVRMAGSVTERYDAKPYGFRFVTCIEADPIPDGQGGELRVEPKKVAESGIYYINGRLRKYDDVLADNNPEESILRSNMRQMPIVCETRNSYRHTGIFGVDDFLVNELGGIVARGDDPELVAYRKEVAERMEKQT